MKLHLYLLGAFTTELRATELPATELSATGLPVPVVRPVHLPTRKVEALLAYLTLHPTIHPREKLAALFWGDSPDEQARGSLRRALNLLREQLGREILLADRLTVQLNPAYPLWVDALEFRAQASAVLASPAPDPDAIDLDLYRGDLLAGFYDDWITPLRDHLRATYVRVALKLSQLATARGDYNRAVELAEAVLAQEPADEEAHRGLMAAYLATGRRTAALEQYARCRRLLRQELDVEPSSETVALYEQIKDRPQPFPTHTQSAPFNYPLPRSRPAAPPNHLPLPPTSFVGRRQELAALGALLPANRLVTLTGAVGIGKTRLALAAVAGLMVEHTYAGGVCWVSLSSIAVSQPDGGTVDQVARAALRALGEPEPEEAPPDARHGAPAAAAARAQALSLLIGALGERAMLLVFDGCGHLVRPCAGIVRELLHACPGLFVLCTGREPLGLPGEAIWPVPPLKLPPLRSAPLGGVFFEQPATGAAPLPLASYDAVRLFVERAITARAGFQLTPANAPAVARICWRLDGLPLAIELAAAQMRSLSAEQLAEQLENRLGVYLRGDAVEASFRVLRALLDWNYTLLDPSEQALLRRLAVFPGEFTAAEVEEVCAGAGLSGAATGEVLATLVDKSLVELGRPDEDREPRYHLLAIIREHGLHRLAAAGEETWLRQRFLERAAPPVG